MSETPARAFGTWLLLATMAPGVAFAQTTGRIAGAVRDASGGTIAGASVTAISVATAQRSKTKTDAAGAYALQLLPPDNYDVIIEAKDFRAAIFRRIVVAVTETTTLDAVLSVGDMTQSILVTGEAPLLQTSGPASGRAVGARAITGLPLATRNFTQILSLFPGTTTYLPDGTAVGRNTQAVSVNGARVTENNVQMNGIDANTMGTNGAILVAVPAPETIQEFIVQSSLYDAGFGRAGGANIQVITKSGTNAFHGDAYEYLRNDGLNASNPFLKAAGVARPELRRNVFGGTLGGPLRRNTSFFFASYQATREVNGASLINSLSQSVLVAQGLTNDRSAAMLEEIFHVSSVDASALALLTARLSDGSFLIPTPRADGRYSGSSRSTFKEDQFNINGDHRVGLKDSLSLRTFVSNTSQFLALPSFRGTGPNVPGFGTDQTFNNRLVAIQEIHTFSPTLSNELRVGYVSNPNTTVPREPITDAQVGIARATAAALPGLPLIRIAPGAGGVIIGTATNLNSAVPWTLTLADALSVSHGRHTVRTGIEIRYNAVNTTVQTFPRGQIDIADFASFLNGITQVTTLGSGLADRHQRAADYNAYVQDDWKVSTRLTLNLGLRYELDLPISETRGRLSTFDPSTGGFVQAGNAEIDVPNVSRVSKYVVKSLDPNNLAPRLGFACAPFESERMVVRGGYGIYYSRPTFQYASLSATAPPNYILGTQKGAPLNDPFVRVPAADRFPLFVPGVALTGTVFDRDLRTPYFHQYSAGVQQMLSKDMVLEVAYLSSTGRKLFRQVAINEAALASADSPLNGVTTNTPANAHLRAPFQGVSISGFSQNQSTARSTYRALQIGATRRADRVYAQASYTYSRSLDDGSGAGAGGGISGVVNTGAVGDTGPILGNQFGPRVNWGVSDFDRPHRFVLSALWDVPSAPGPGRARSWLGRWQLSGIVTAMSGLPIDIVDTGAGSFYGLADGNSPLARPNLVDAGCDAAMRNIPPGYAFNPFAFARSVVEAGQPIPSSRGTAIAGGPGTDLGTTPRNCLRGPWQRGVDVAAARRVAIRGPLHIELRVEIFNLFNQVNLANPISNLTAVTASGGGFDRQTGRVLDPGSFGRIISTSSGPRIMQLAVKFSY